MNRYARGRRAEWALRRALEDSGFFVVRSAGSKGPVDLVAISRDGYVLLYQVKSSKITAADRRSIVQMSKKWPSSNMTFILVQWGSGRILYEERYTCGKKFWATPKETEN